MSEQESRHSQLRHRLKSRISEELFESMPLEIQDYLLELPQEDIKEAYLNVMLKIPWMADKTVPNIDLRLARIKLDRSHYAMYDV